MYLVAVKDWYSRKLLSWQLSNTLDVSFYPEALEAALTKYGTPEIFNTDQGSQYTSSDFTNKLKASNIKISMDGQGCWVDKCIYRKTDNLIEQNLYLAA